MLAMVAGAAFIACGGRALSIEVPVVAVIWAAFVGAIADSVVGATLQDRRWCDTCADEHGAARCTTAAPRRATRAGSRWWTTIS